jgi:signal transduction histidine kinase
LLLQNLITNAIKFRHPDRVPEIAIEAWEENSHWKFVVKDNGIGIESQFLERIFIIFQRLNSRTKYEGSGIGLAHCKKIVELHGGSISAQSQPGQGSQFYFTISKDL